MKTSNAQLPPIHQPDTQKKMESELKVTRKELETTKQALKIQAARCRHLVTAFTRKLAERDAELRACRQHREKQLSGLLRALLVLEARLRREQKSIKELLAEKDNLINSQKIEIEMLKTKVKEGELAGQLPNMSEESQEAEEGLMPKISSKKSLRIGVYAKPDLISSLGISDGSSKDGGPDSLSSESTKSGFGDESDYTVVAAPQVKGVLNVHDHSAFSPISKSKVDQRKFSTFSQSTPDISKAIPQDETAKPSALLQEISIGEGHDKYLDNPVLQCVNQILLKDQEDFLEEQRSRTKDGDELPRARDWLDEEESPIEGEGPCDFNNQETILEITLPLAKKSISLSDLSKDKSASRLNPPLPPKPKIGSKKVDFSSTVEFCNSSLPVVTPSQPDIESQNQFDLSLSMLEPLDQGQDKDLYVISNSALDDDIVKQLRGRTLNVSGLHIKPQRVGNDMNQHSNVPTGLLHPNHNTRPKSPSTSLNYEATNQMYTPTRTPPSNRILKVNIQESPKRSAFGFVSPPKVGMPNMIKVASPVATLLTFGGAEEAAADNNQDVSPRVSQMVRRFEDLGTSNKGETDDSNLKDGKRSPSSSTESSPARLTTDNSPNCSTSSSNNSSIGAVSYDNFLEATGLSQKSIITPNRMMTNHRNVVRPKDIKLRSKVRTAGVVERCIPPQVVGPTIKYWTEPFL